MSTALCCVVLYPLLFDPPVGAVPEVKPFPAGLNDCYAGLRFCFDNRADLGFTEDILVSGESGGGNLAIATVMKAKRAGELHLCRSGLFALCPYIAGAWPVGVKDDGRLGTSHIDNARDGEGGGRGSGGGVPELGAAIGYGLEQYEEKNPLAWPAFASLDDLRGLPRTVISVNEGDVYRDEGVIFYRKLCAAGVTAECRTVMGTPHAADVNLWSTIPETVMTTVKMVASFATNGRPVSPMPHVLPPC